MSTFVVLFNVFKKKKKKKRSDIIGPPFFDFLYLRGVMFKIVLSEQNLNNFIKIPFSEEKILPRNKTDRNYNKLVI